MVGSTTLIGDNRCISPNKTVVWCCFHVFLMAKLTKTEPDLGCRQNPGIAGRKLKPGKDPWPPLTALDPGMEPLIQLIHGNWSTKTRELIAGWWARATPLKNMTSSIGMRKFPTEWENKKWQPVTTNQLMSTICRCQPSWNMSLRSADWGWGSRVAGSIQDPIVGAGHRQQLLRSELGVDLGLLREIVDLPMKNGDFP